MTSLWNLVTGLVAARSYRLKGVKHVWVEETGMLSVLIGELYQGSCSDCCFWNWATCMYQNSRFSAWIWEAVMLRGCDAFGSNMGWIIVGMR